MKLTIVSSSSGDWEGLYVDGILKEEGHSLQVESVLALLGHEVEMREAARNWVEDEGCLPEKLSDVKFPNQRPR